MQQQFSEEDIRLVDVFDSFKSYLIYLLKKWYISIVGVAAITWAGYAIAIYSTPKYVAYISFNAVDSKASAMGGIMSMMGVSFAGGSSNDVLTGIFSSRNIFLNSMLSDMEVDGKKEKIANVYMSAFEYNDGFEDDPEWKGFKFTANSIPEISKKEMELLAVMYDDFIGGLMVAEYDIATGLIKGEIETPDYELSRQLGATLLRNTVKFYQNKQVENAKISFNSVEKRLDSISNEIIKRQQAIASSQDLNVFNKKRVTVVEQQKLAQEMGTLSIMYNEASASKENAKIGLDPQNNIVRIVDDPLFSTALSPPSKLLYTIIGFAVSLVVVIIPLLISKAVQDGREEDKQRAALDAAATDA